MTTKTPCFWLAGRLNHYKNINLLLERGSAELGHFKKDNTDVDDLDNACSGSLSAFS